MTLAIEGAATATFSGGTTGTINITTGGTDRIIEIVIYSEKDSVAQSVASVTASGLTFALRKQLQWGPTSGFNTDNVIETWWAYAAAQQTATTITVTLNVATDDAAMVVFAATGVIDTSAPWDVNGSLPATSAITAFTSNIPTVSGVSTSAANTLVIAAAGCSRNQFTGPDTGYSTIGEAANGGGANYGYLGVYYKLFSSEQSSITVHGNASIGQPGWLVDALSGGGINRTPGVGSLALSTVAPIRSATNSLVSAVGSLALSSAAPTVSNVFNTDRVPGVALLFFSPTAPVISTRVVAGGGAAAMLIGI